MALPQITSRNALQGVGFLVSKLGRVTNANTGLYTVPAGKVAKVVSIQGNLDAVGADASYSVAIKRGASFFPAGAHVIVNGISQSSGILILQAADIITNVGDSGSTNGTMDMFATVQEFDA